MNNLKKMVASLSLMSAFAVTAFAQNCQPPGESQCPPLPCSTAQLAPDESTNPGQTETPSAPVAADTVTVAEDALVQFLIF